MRYLPIILLLLAPVTGFALELDAQTDFARRLALNSSVSARIDTIRVAPGDRVAAGEVVISLVDTGLRAHAAKARAEADALEPVAARRLTELEKARELFARESLALVELQTAEQDYTIARARLAAAEAKLERALFLLSQAQIRSPIDGVVIEVSAFAGQYVNTRVENRQLLKIADIDSMIASALLPYESAQASLVNRPASVRYGDRVYRGRVVEVGRQVQAGKNNHPAVVLRVAFESAGELAAGLPVRISIADE